MVAGSLPAGLSLNPDTGLVSGVPLAEDPQLLIIQVQDGSLDTFSGTVTVGSCSGDVDGDGFDTCQDCNANDGTVWQPPFEATNLRFGADGQTLSWDPPANAGGDPASVTYDTLRSGIPSDFAEDGTCVESNDGTDTSAVDATQPEEGEPFYYLVRPENDCGADLGQLGVDSDGSPRSGASCP